MWPGDSVVEKPLPVTEGSVSSLAFSADGKTLAAGYVYVHHSYSDIGVLLWDVAGRKRVIQAPLPVREGRVESMAFSPDGKTLAGGYTHADNTPGGVVLWDVAGRKRVVEKPLPVTQGRLSSLAFSPDSKTLATSYTRLRGTPGGGVVLWDVAGCKRLIQATLPETRGQVARVAFAPDGKTLAAACGLESNSVVFWDSVMLWDVAGHKRVMQLLLPSRASARAIARASLAFTPDGKTLAAAYVRASLVLYNQARQTIIISVTLWDVAEHNLLVKSLSP